MTQTHAQMVIARRAQRRIEYGRLDTFLYKGTRLNRNRIIKFYYDGIFQ